MSSKAAEALFLIARGERVKSIRDSLGFGGEEFAAAVNSRGREFGVSLGYDKTKVSRLESGKVAFFTAEEAVVIAALDPEEQGIERLVFGRTRQHEAPAPIAKYRGQIVAGTGAKKPVPKKATGTEGKRPK